MIKPKLRPGVLDRLKYCILCISSSHYSLPSRPMNMRGIPPSTTNFSVEHLRQVLDQRLSLEVSLNWYWRNIGLVSLTEHGDCLAIVANK